MPVAPPLPAGYRLSISRKVILLFMVLALAAAGSWLVVHRALARFDGVATDIERYGSLRYLSQAIQVALNDAAHGGSTDGIDPLAIEFETNLRRLESGVPQAPADAEARRHLGVISANWPDYRVAIRQFLEAPAMASDHAADLLALSALAGQILDEANRAVWAQSEGAARLQQEVRNDLLGVALVDAVILIFAFIYIRWRIALPLRDLAGITLRFAGGDHEARSGFRSHDEIGALAAAFNYMAAQTGHDFAVIAADLDDIRRKEAELRKLTQAIEHSPASVMITDAAGTIEYINPRFTEVSGYAPDEAVGCTPRILQSGQTLPETYRQMWQTVRSGRVWRGELLNRKKNGELFWENTQISPVRGETGRITHFVSVKEDVTARKQAEQALALLNVELEQRVAARTRQLAAANRELQAFSHSVSHDLRTPLRAIEGFARAIEEDGGSALTGELPDYLRRIQAAAVRMGELIDALLEVGRVGQMEVMAQPVHLGRMAREILAGFASREPGRRAEFEVDTDVVVDGDPRLLRIALESLLGNAWKFSAGRDPARIVFGHAGAGSPNALMVKDNGVGFNMHYADKLFRPFQRLHASGRFEGAGIGLATVKRVIELHGGRVWAEGEPERGAAFYLELPAAQPGNVLTVGTGGNAERQALVAS